MSDSRPEESTAAPLDVWLEDLSKATGSPGGGAASAVMLAISAALLQMVARYTPDDPRAADCVGRLTALRRRALAAAEQDGRRSADLGAAMGAPKEEAGRDERIAETAVAASRSSAELGAIGEALVDELRVLSDIGNPALAADLVVAAEALASGLAGASVNLRADVGLARRHERRDAAEPDGFRAIADAIAQARSIALRVGDAHAATFDRP